MSGCANHYLEWERKSYKFRKYRPYKFHTKFLDRKLDQLILIEIENLKHNNSENYHILQIL